MLGKSKAQSCHCLHTLCLLCRFNIVPNFLHLTWELVAPMSFPPLKDAGGEIMPVNDFGDICLPLFEKSPEQKKAQLDSFKTMQFRSDDVFLFSFPKSGTHWVFEIANMLRRGVAECSEDSFYNRILEISTLDTFNAVSSPRIVVTHLLPDKLPDDLLISGQKIILVLRNPKDVIVSMYHHAISQTIIPYKGKWKNFLSVFLRDKCVYYPWFTVVDTWQRLKAEHPSAPILTVMYEDLIKNPLIEVNRIADFLDVAVDGERATLIQKVVDKCGFNNMKKNEINKGPGGSPYIFRKGMIGDWKNHFTVAENEMFDAWYQQRMTHNDLKFTFT